MIFLYLKFKKKIKYKIFLVAYHMLLKFEIIWRNKVKFVDYEIISIF